MFFETIVVLALLALAGWWLHQRRKAAMPPAAGADEEPGRHDHAQAYERAKAEAELQRWNGPQ